MLLLDLGKFLKKGSTASKCNRFENSKNEKLLKVFFSIINDSILFKLKNRRIEVLTALYPFDLYSPLIP
jgi:hypothetical protein